jgi:hypothetical protein
MKTLGLNTLRRLHRYIEDLPTLRKIRVGSMPSVELERLLREAGADPSEIQGVLADYQQLRGAL